ncbi:MAG: GntR family transcriptional regulator [Verrucomicrobia bacterium]|nr:GntR family transcriptional regulator [Verrucomicrobiota bacterium]
MALIGKLNRLRLVRHAPPGAFMDGGELGEILLPRRYVPQNAAPGDELELFVYRDSEDRLVATTEKPLATVGDFACLKVLTVNRDIGAFLEWGLAKDLLLPFREQISSLRPGQRVMVHVYLDPKTNRIVATARLKRHLSRSQPPYLPGQSVRLVIADKTPLGYNAIVEGTYMGLLFTNNRPSNLEVGQQVKGFVRAVHPGGKIDLSLDAAGYQRVAPLVDQIVETLRQNGGRLPFDDNSSPESIRDKFGISKKAFKQAVGKLYKARRIRFLNPGIELIADAR